jgi:formylglycine-generating enzyme required for sulfatase activity
MNVFLINVLFIFLFGSDEMITMESGCFEMGCQKGDKYCKPDEKPLRKVCLDSFSIDRTEVTVSEFKKCLEAKVCSEVVRTCKIDRENCDNYPVTGISWFEAQKFCQWKNKRLPTEAEWEYAARGKTSNIYPWGNDHPKKILAAKYHYGKNYTETVCSLASGNSPAGLCDMAGNAYEWVLDWYSPKNSAKGKNPKGPCEGKINCSGYKLRILKGGSSASIDTLLRISARYPLAPKRQLPLVGFRCAK